METGEATRDGANRPGADTTNGTRALLLEHHDNPRWELRTVRGGRVFRRFRFEAISVASAQEEARKFAKLLGSLLDRLRPIATFDLNIEALQGANVAGAAVNAVDALTWQIPSAADLSAQD